MSDPSARGWEAVDHAEERLETRAAARQRAADRRRRRRGWVAWTLRVLLPLAGAAAVLGLVHDRRLAEWTPAAAAAIPAAILLAAALASAWLGRRDGVVVAVLWGAVTLAAELALVFAVGLAALGLGPA